MNNNDAALNAARNASTPLLQALLDQATSSATTTNATAETRELQVRLAAELAQRDDA